MRGLDEGGDSFVRVVVVPIEVGGGADYAEELWIFFVDGFDGVLGSGEIFGLFVGLGEAVLEHDALDGIGGTAAILARRCLAGSWR